MQSTARFPLLAATAATALLVPAIGAGQGAAATARTQNARTLRIHFADAARWKPVAVESYRNAIFFDATINGTPAVVALDTGSDATLIDAGFARRAGLETAGAGPVLDSGRSAAASALARGVTLDIPDHLTVSGDVATYDLAPLGRLMGHRVDAILGGDVLRSLAIIVQPRRRSLSLVASGAYQVQANAVRVPLTEGGGVAARVNDVPVELLVDLGSNNVVTLSSEAWARAVPADAVVRAGRSTRVEGVARATRRADGNRLAVGSFSADAVPVVESGSLPAGHEGLLGGGFFARFDTVIDYPLGLVALVPLAGPPRQPDDG